MRILRKALTLGVLGGILSAGSVLGAGFQLYTEGSAEAVGQAAAITGRTDALSNAWYNPAALAYQQQPELMLGGAYVDLNIDYSSPTVDDSLEKGGGWIPSLFYAHPINDDMVGVLSVTTPYGLATDWAGTWAGNRLAIDTQIRTVFLNGALTYRVTDKLAVAGGVSLVQADALIRQNIGGPELQVEGMAYGMGYMLGAHYTFNDEWQMGAKFQSRTNMELEGESSYNMALPILKSDDVEADLSLPASMAVGFTNRSFDCWTLGLDVVWTQYC
jgi:long-chain fatty acid transport protein